MVVEQMPKKIFVSCASKDERYRKQLSAHLSPQKRRKLITTWFKGKVQPGSDCQHEIEIHLDAADIILLLMSSDYIRSDDCYAEMQRALEREAANEATVIPIIVRPCTWSRVLSSKHNLLPSNRKAISVWRNRDMAWDDVARDIHKEVSRIGLSRVPSPAPPFSPIPSVLSYKRDNPSLVSSELGDERLARVYQPIQRGPVSPDPRVSRSRVVSTEPGDGPAARAYRPIQRGPVSPDPRVSTFREGRVVSTVPNDAPPARVYRPIPVSPDPFVSTYREDTTERHWVGWIILIVLAVVGLVLVLLLHSVFHLI